MMLDIQQRELAPLMHNSFALTLLDGMSIRELWHHLINKPVKLKLAINHLAALV